MALYSKVLNSGPVWTAPAGATPFEDKTPADDTTKIYPTGTPAVPVGTLVRSIRLVNTSANSRKFKLFLRSAGAAFGDSIHIAPKTVTLPPKAAYVVGEDLTLSSGDALHSFHDGTAAGDVVYSIFGVEQEFIE